MDHIGDWIHRILIEFLEKLATAPLPKLT